MKLTVKQLLDAGGSSECPQVTLFVKLFGDEVEVTEELAAKYALEFNWRWATESLLSLTALAEYDRIMARARAKYRLATAPALAEYERIGAAALSNYEPITTPAWAEYNCILATTFARLYNEEGQ